MPWANLTTETASPSLNLPLFSKPEIAARVKVENKKLIIIPNKLLYKPSMKETDLHQNPKLGTLVGNLGEPIKLADLMLNGVTAEAAKGGQTVQMWTRLYLTSDDLFFYKIVENISKHIEYCSSKIGRTVDLKRVNFTLLVIHPDNTGDLWVDTAAISLNIRVKRALSAGTMIFEKDIADIIGMSFPLVEIKKQDRVLCIFREGWRFGLFFDFNPDEDLSIEAMERDLGSLYRRLKYRDLYDSVSDNLVFTKLVEAGWFPFVEILPDEFRELAQICEAGFELIDTENELLRKFDAARIESMFTRWMGKPHFSGKERLLRSALNNFNSGDSIAVLKIVLTEIEGILSEAYQQTYGKNAKLKKLLDFAIESAKQKSGYIDTLLFPEAFAHYMKHYTFAEYDPVNKTGKASSRHAIGHGAADASTYTQIRALQALLTLDQIAFYT